DIVRARPVLPGDRVVALAEETREILVPIAPQRPFIRRLDPLRQRREPAARRPSHELRRRSAERVVAGRGHGGTGSRGDRQTPNSPPPPVAPSPRRPVAPSPRPSLAPSPRPGDGQRLRIAGIDLPARELGAE